MSQYPPALWLPADHYGFATPFQPRYIIIHATAGDRTPQAVQTTVNQRGTSVHNSIGLDGLVGQHVTYDVAAYGNGVVTGPSGKGGDGIHHDSWWDASPGGNPNNETISIEHCKVSTDNSDALTPAQKAASFALVAWLCDRFGIARRWADANGGITGHFSMDPVNRSRCPGTYPWDELFAYLNGNAGGTQVVNTQGLGAGDAAEAQAENSGVAIVETYIGPQSVATLQNGTALWWDGSQVHALAGAAGAVKLLLDDRNALLQQLTQVKAQLAQAQSQPPAPPAPGVDANAIADAVVARIVAKVHLAATFTN